MPVPVENRPRNEGVYLPIPLTKGPRNVRDIRRAQFVKNIDAKLEGLKQRGFHNPVKLINSWPMILELAFNNIDAKMEGLKQRGFHNPVKLIMTFPGILGLAFNNIDRKIRLLCLLHGDRTKAIMEIEAFPTLLSYKWRRLLFAVRTSHPDGLRTLITINPQLLAAAKGTTGSDDPTRLASVARQLKCFDIEHIINQLIDDGRIDPRLVRALSRLASTACRAGRQRTAGTEERTPAYQKNMPGHQHVRAPSRSLHPVLSERLQKPSLQRRLDLHLWRAPSLTIAQLFGTADRDRHYTRV